MIVYECYCAVECRTVRMYYRYMYAHVTLAIVLSLSRYSAGRLCVRACGAQLGFRILWGMYDILAVVCALIGLGGCTVLTVLGFVRVCLSSGSNFAGKGGDCEEGVVAVFADMYLGIVVSELG